MTDQNEIKQFEIYRFIYLVREMRQAQKQKVDAITHIERLVDDWLAKEDKERKKLDIELDIRLAEAEKEHENLYGAKNDSGNL